MTLARLSAWTWAIGLLAAGVVGPARAQAPRAVVPTTEHDFGTLIQGAKVSHRFEIQNEGDRPLTLQRVDVSAPGMKARFRQTVPAGQKGSPAGSSQFFQVQVQLDAERLRPGALTGIVRIGTDSEQFPELTVRVKGELR